jgi:hypothetical protein
MVGEKYDNYSTGHDIRYLSRSVAQNYLPCPWVGQGGAEIDRSSHPAA